MQLGNVACIKMVIDRDQGVSVSTELEILFVKMIFLAWKWPTIRNVKSEGEL